MIQFVKTYKYQAQKLLKFISHVFSVKFNHLFNATVRRQLKDYKCIPVIIISFNQLYYLRKLIDFLKDHNFTNIIIIDNNSTYRPLLNYLENLDTIVTLHKLDVNDGHLAFWKQTELVEKYTKGYYVITDPDIVPLKECPDDFLKTFKLLLDRAYTRTKVGFSLKIDDIPDTNLNKQKIINWESQYWKTKTNSKAYKAPIDTTFALYRPHYKYKLKDFTKAWRTDYPVQAKHGGWYIDPKALTIEQKHYQETANSSASWLIDGSGELASNTHNKIYTNDE